MQQAKAGTPIVYYVFDLLEVDGEPVIDLPLSERRQRLRKLLDGRNRTVKFSEGFADGPALYQAAQEQRLEGIMGKRLDSKYLPGKRSRDWLKFKTHGEQEFVIAGYTRGKGRREWSFGSLVLATNGDDGLEWVGNVGTGFDDAEQERLLKKLRPLERKTSPFPRPPKMPRVRKDDVVWVEPKLVAEVSFAEFTTTAGCARRFTWACARTRTRARCAARRRSRADRRHVIRKGKRTLGSRTSTSRSGRTRGSPRATCSRSTATWRPCCSRTCATGRSRCALPDGLRQGVLPEGPAAGMPDWIPTVNIEVTTRDKPRRGAASRRRS
jgi:ATP-dependent DNA ligase